MNLSFLSFFITLSIGIAAYLVVYFVKPLKIIKNKQTRFIIDIFLYLTAITVFIYLGIVHKHSLLILFSVAGIWFLYKRIICYVKH